MALTAPRQNITMRLSHLESLQLAACSQENKALKQNTAPTTQPRGDKKTLRTKQTPLYTIQASGGHRRKKLAGAAPGTRKSQQKPYLDQLEELSETLTTEVSKPRKLYVKVTKATRPSKNPTPIGNPGETPKHVSESAHC